MYLPADLPQSQSMLVALSPQPLELQITYGSIAILFSSQYLSLSKIALFIYLYAHLSFVFLSRI